MGTTASSHTSTDKCNCFVNDNQIRDVDIVHYLTSVWIWSKSHDNALIDTISDFYYIVPKEIMLVIKEFSFHQTEEYLVMQPYISREKYYSKPIQLLKKNLCQNWYQQTEFTTSSFLVALHVSDSRNSKQIYNALNIETLPALQCPAQPRLYLNKYEQIRRTIFIDQSQISLHLITINNDNIDNEILKYPHINIITLKETEPLMQANNICKKIWNQKKSMKNCIIVCLKDNVQNSQNTNAMHQLAKYYNIPFIADSFNTHKTIADLLSFAVKYYWFCSVVK